MPLACVRILAAALALASILLGFPNAGSRNFLQVPYYITNVQYSGFVQDDWKVSPRLTLNLGVRYDVFTPDVEKDNKLANFNENTLVFDFAGQNGVGRTAGIQTRYGNVGPRVGLAYDLDGKGIIKPQRGFDCRPETTLSEVQTARPYRKFAKKSPSRCLLCRYWWQASKYGPKS